MQPYKPYNLDQVPAWCHMSLDEHQCCGGCWGISYGDVAEKGEKYCLNCEYHVNNVPSLVEAKHE